MPDKTTIKLHPTTRDRLRAAKIGGESYDETLTRLLDALETAEMEVAPE